MLEFFLRRSGGTAVQVPECARHAASDMKRALKPVPAGLAGLGTVTGKGPGSAVGTSLAHGPVARHEGAALLLQHILGHCIKRVIVSQDVIRLMQSTGRESESAADGCLGTAVQGCRVGMTSAVFRSPTSNPSWKNRAHSLFYLNFHTIIAINID
jgi:hypothetical protein